MLQRDIQQLQPHTDIFCLEEMSPETYQDFQRTLGNEYGSHIVKRQFNRPLHNAMFYNKSKFQLEAHHKINLHKGLHALDISDENLREHQTLDFHAICNHFTIISQDTNKKTKQHLLVMMAHFHHNPLEDVIKYAEMSNLLNEVGRIRQEIMQQKEIKESDIYTILAGDFNAQPSNQVYRMAVLGEPPSLPSLLAETMVLPRWIQQRQTWLPLYQQIYEKTDKSLVGNFASVYSVYHNADNDDINTAGERGHPRYTNLTDTFTNTIDYILYEKSRLLPTCLLELDTETYEKEEFLPSQFHASDHVPLWAEFQLR